MRYELKNKLITMLSMALLLSISSTYGAYQIKVHLEPSSIKLGNNIPEVPETPSEPEDPEEPIENPTINIDIAPTNVWVSNGFSLSWSGTNVVNYKIRSNNVNSGVSTSDVDLNNSTSYSITPNAAGTYTYTITATSSTNESTSINQTVVVESLPSIDSFSASPTTVLANGSTNLSWSASNAGTLTIDQSIGVVSGNSITVNVGSTTGSKTYTLSTSRTINGDTRNASRSVTITINAGKVCRYDANNQWYVEYEDQTQSTGALIQDTSISWDGAYIASSGDISTTSFNVGGYLYTRGTLRSNSGGGLWWVATYEICRE